MRIQSNKRAIAETVFVIQTKTAYLVQKTVVHVLSFHALEDAPRYGTAQNGQNALPREYKQEHVMIQASVGPHQGLRKNPALFQAVLMEFKTRMKQTLTVEALYAIRVLMTRNVSLIVTALTYVMPTQVFVTHPLQY